MRLFSLCISLPGSSLRACSQGVFERRTPTGSEAFSLRPLSQDTKNALSQSLILEPLVKATFRERPRPLFGLTVLEFSIVFNLLLNSEVHCKIGQKLRWLDWIFLRGYLLSLSINYVAMSKDMGKRLPQLYYIKTKISYDLGFIAIGVAMAT